MFATRVESGVMAWTVRTTESLYFNFQVVAERRRRQFLQLASAEVWKWVGFAVQVCSLFVGCFGVASGYCEKAFAAVGP